MGCTVVGLTKNGSIKPISALLDVSNSVTYCLFFVTRYSLMSFGVPQLYIKGFANRELADNYMTLLLLVLYFPKFLSHRRGWESNPRLGALHAILCCRVP